MSFSSQSMASSAAHRHCRKIVRQRDWSSLSQLEIFGSNTLRNRSSSSSSSSSMSISSRQTAMRSIHSHAVSGGSFSNATMHRSPPPPSSPAGDYRRVRWHSRRSGDNTAATDVAAASPLSTCDTRSPYSRNRIGRMQPFGSHPAAVLAVTAQSRLCRSGMPTKQQSPQWQSSRGVSSPAVTSPPPPFRHGTIHHSPHHHHHDKSPTTTGIHSSRGFSTVSTFLSGLSPRQEAHLENQILASLQTNVIDPVLHKDIHSLGWVSSVTFPQSRSFPSMHYSPSPAGAAEGVDGGGEEWDVLVTLRLPTLLHPFLDGICGGVRSTVRRELLLAAGGGGEGDHGEDVAVGVEVETQRPIPFVRNVEDEDGVVEGLGPGLANVAHFLAVYSCKGGVGKSTIAANLAYELARMGGKIGIVDLDIYGPSLPVLIKPTDPAVRKSPLGEGMVYPIEHGGVKLLSLGFVSPTSGVPGSGDVGGAAVMRGPMAGRVVTQLLKGTDWGELDILILDLPPGTGDVQITLCQDLQLSGAVSVTTPSKLALTDARKGIQMFTSMGVPTLALVENMAFFECEGGGKHYPFGKATTTTTTTTTTTSNHELGLPPTHIFQLPISPHTNNANETGSPLCLSRPPAATEELSTFRSLSDLVASQLLLLRYGKPLLGRDGGDDGGGADAGGIYDGNVTLGGAVFNVSDLLFAVGGGGEGECFIVRFFSDVGATEVTVPAEKLRRWHPQLGEAMEEDDGDEHDCVEEDSGGGGMGNVVVETTRASSGGGGCSSNHDHSHGHHHHHHSPPKEPTLKDFTTSSNGRSSSSSSSLFPCKIEKKGRYGYSVEWADGATIIYSMYSLARAAGGIPIQSSGLKEDDTS